MKRINPLLAALAVAVAVLPGTALTAPKEEGLYVVRFRDRITDAARASVVAAGLRVIDYEPANSYLVWGTSGEADRAAGLAAVRSAEPLAAGRKLGPGLADEGLLPYVNVTVYGPAKGDAIRALSDLGVVHRSYRADADGLLVTVAMALPAASIEDAARNPAVLYLSPGSPRAFPEDEATDQIAAGNIDPEENRPVTGYAAWLEEQKLDGDGFTAAIVDTGVEGLHPDLFGRVRREQNYASPVDTVDTLGHGTHVAGIVGGSPPLGSRPADPDGFVHGVGIAPAVEVLDINAIATTASFPPEGGFQTLSRDAWQGGARIWNASWHTGEGQRVGYTASARAMDEISRNADPGTPGSEEFLLVFSAGNAGGSGPTAPKEAKNLISVGATSSGRNIIWPREEDIDQVASFSSKGPMKDKRNFPVVSAPGSYVISARAPEGVLTATCVPPPDGAGLYASCSGTSMAAPHVTGSSILIHQWWKRETGALPSPAMVKALLVNGATDMGKGDIPNRNEGWGRINLGNVFAATPDLFVDQGTVLGDLGQSATYTVESDGGPLRATLAWSDAPGAVGADPALVNDLDLAVERLGSDGLPVQAWLGNAFEGGTSVTGGSPDRLNNVENVFLGSAEAGTYRITVAATNLPGDGIPENEDPTDQDFALVLRGGRPAA